MSPFKPALLIAAALFCADALADPPAYDGRAQMLEMGPLWLDPALSADEQLRVSQDLLKAHEKIIAAYGERLTSPRVVWCKTKECSAFFAGTDGRSHSASGNGKPRPGAQYAFSFPAVVITLQATSPRYTRGAEVLAHEFSHSELHARLRGASVPAWFNEGIASSVGGDRDCRPGMRGIDNLFYLQDSQWIKYTNDYPEKRTLTYCQARNEVEAWMAERGGFAAVLELLAKRSRGKPFVALYGKLHENLVPPDASSPAPAEVESSN